MKKLFLPEDLKRFSYLSWPAVSQDKDLIACTVRTAEETSGDHIPAVSVFRRQEDGTFSECPHLLLARADQAVFLKDGRTLLYLSDASGEKQIWSEDLESGEKRQLSSLRHGIKNYRLSPDENAAVFEAVLWPEEVRSGLAFTEMSPEEKKVWEDELEYTPYEAEDLTYKLDEWYGMRKGEFSHVGVLSFDGSRKEIIDTDGHEAFTPSWSHDGRTVAFCVRPYGQAKGFQKELFTASASDLKPVQITEDLGVYDEHPPLFSKDDQSLITMTFAPYEDYSTVLVPYRVDLKTKEAVKLLGDWDDQTAFGSSLLIAGRTENGQNPYGQVLSHDGEYLYFLSGSKGHTGIYRLPLGKNEPGKVETVLLGETDIQGFCLDKDDAPVILQGDFTHPAELFYEGKQITDKNAWLREYEFPLVTEHSVMSKDSKELLHYFLWHPVNEEAEKKYPAVLDIKGGPDTMYAAAYWHEFHALSSAGMAVICPNVRGSSGFSRSYMANIICWDPEIVEDVEAIVNDAVSQDFIDPSRIGVTGGSYGGYLTNKLMGRTTLFAAAVTQRSLVNPVTSYGTGDQGFISSRPVPADFKMRAVFEDRAKDNIISYIDHFKIPLLILHGGRDYRCTFEQAEQLFIAMKERNPEVPVRLVRFPLENHELTRTGKLYNQVRHLREMLNWFVRYLQEKEVSHA